MKNNLIFLFVLAGLTACTQPAVVDDRKAADDAVNNAEIAQTAPIADTAPKSHLVADGEADIAPDAEPPPPPYHPPQKRLPTDLAPCPGINPDIRRPAGSNCLGITPVQCGADKAQGYVGKMPSDADHSALRSMAKSTADRNFRWIPYMTAVIEDLRPHRFNVELGKDGRIVKIDCY